jgi:isochorismate synthase
MTATRDARTGLGAGVGERLAALLSATMDEGLASATSIAPSLDPIAVYAAAVEADLEATLWLHPSDGAAFVGVGRAWAVEPSGDVRFQAAEAAWRDLIAGARIDRPADAAPGAGPVLLGGMGFTGESPAEDDAWAPFGASSLVLPELLLTVTPAGAFVTASLVAGTDGGARRLDAVWARLVDRARELRPSPNGIVAMPVYAPLRIADEQPTHDVWRRLVGMYAGAVGRGRIDKVVLARRVDMRSPVELDVPNALRRLAASAPESTTYAFRRDGRTFLGATPERLVRTEGRTFRTVAVAGTIRRGADAEEDAQLARRLLASEKDREEQVIVVDAIRDLLAPVADSLTVAPEPNVMTLRFVQHLVTEISGTLPEGRGLLALGERLHPTPAVGGDPRDVALALIAEHEGFDRGWYAGPIGWLGADGDGELCVALRCGIVNRTHATLFAGCGIVADSDPDQEWEESRIKLRAIISALGIPGDAA